MKIKCNLDDYELYCDYSKERIMLGEKYIEYVDEYMGDKITKILKLDYATELEEEIC